MGILVKSVRFFEAANDIDTIVFEKTGTLTTGELRVAAVDCPDGYDEDTLLALAGSIEQHSTHPIARAIVSAANQRGLVLWEATAVQEKPGHGLSATIGEQEIVVGRSNWLQERRISAPAVDQRFSGLSALLVGVNGSYAGVIFLSDTLRPEARAATTALRADGIEYLTLLTGDRLSVAETLAANLEITDVRAECLPEQNWKSFASSSLKGAHKVMVVSDGVERSRAHRWQFEWRWVRSEAMLPFRQPNRSPGKRPQDAFPHFMELS